MKKIKNLLAIVSIMIASCNHDVSTLQNNRNSSNSTSITGNFTITKSTDNLSENKTGSFDGYTFVFTADEEINALKNNIASPGSYIETLSHEGEGAKLKINFSDAPLDELNKNWQVDVISNNAIHLSDDDASSGEVLEFTAQ